MTRIVVTTVRCVRSTDGSTTTTQTRVVEGAGGEDLARELDQVAGEFERASLSAFRLFDQAFANVERAIERLTKCR